MLWSREWMKEPPVFGRCFSTSDRVAVSCSGAEESKMVDAAVSEAVGAAGTAWGTASGSTVDCAAAAESTADGTTIKF
jgi:hypothetical protein